MDLSQPSRALNSAFSYDMLIETIDSSPQNELHGDGDDDSPISYRSSPDGSLTMGTDRLSGQVVLIVQNAENRWEIALPPKVARFATSDNQITLAAAKQIATDAFQAYWASLEK